MDWLGYNEPWLDSVLEVDADQDLAHSDNHGAIYISASPALLWAVTGPGT